MKYKIDCRRCGERYWKKSFHECPPLFIHKLDNNEIVIRGKDLTINWIDHILVIRNEKGVKRNEQRK